MFYSKLSGGFYTTEIHGSNIPDDAVEITIKQHQALLDGQSIGKIISSDENGYPILIDPVQLDFTDLKSAALAAIDNYHAQQVQDLIGNPTQTEKDTWALKLETANAIINNAELTMASNAFLTSAGLDSDLDRLNWANSVIAKSVRYSTFVGVAERLRDNARTAIKAATTEEELNTALEVHRKIAEDAVAELSVS